MNFSLLYKIGSSPEPCVVFRVSVSPNCPLIEAGEVYLALNTLVGPISSLQWRMASSRARTYALIGPLRWCISKTPATTTRKKKNNRTNQTQSALTDGGGFLSPRQMVAVTFCNPARARTSYFETPAGNLLTDYLQGCFSKHIITQIIKLLLSQRGQWFAGGMEWMHRCVMCFFFFSVVVRGVMHSEMVERFTLTWIQQVFGRRICLRCKKKKAT